MSTSSSLSFFFLWVVAHYIKSYSHVERKSLFSCNYSEARSTWSNYHTMNYLSSQRINKHTTRIDLQINNILTIKIQSMRTTNGIVVNTQQQPSFRLLFDSFFTYQPGGDLTATTYMSRHSMPTTISDECLKIWQKMQIHQWQTNRRLHSIAKY